MLRKILSIWIFLSVLMLSMSSADALVYSWDGGGDGTSWEDADNWNREPDVPSSSDDINIETGTCHVHAETGSVSCITG